MESLGVASNAELQLRVVDAIRAAQADDPFAPVTLIASSAAQGWELRRQIIAGMPAGTALANLRVLTLVEFMDACRLTLGPSAEPIDRLVRAVAVEQLLTTETGPLAASAAHPDTARLITRIADEVAWCSIDEDALEQEPLASTTTATSRAALRFVARMRRELTGPAAVTHHADVAARVQQANAQQLQALGASVGAIVCTEQRVPAPALAVLQTLAAAGTPVTRLALAPSAALPQGTQLVSAPDPATEVSIAVRAVAAHIDAGVAPERIALLYSTSDPYAALLDAELGAAHIEWRGPTADALETLALPQVALLLTRMAVARTATSSGITRRDLMRWLGIGSITLDGVSVHAGRLRGLIREKILHGDARQWLHALDAFEALGIPTGEEPDRDIQQQIDTAANAHQLAALLRRLDAGLERLVSSSTWEEVGIALQGLIAGFHGELTATSRDADERSAAPMLRSLLLSSFPRIDAFVTSGKGPSASDVLAVLERQFIGRRTRHGRTSAGVHVGPLESARTLTFDALVIIGAAEGTLPPISSSDTVLADPLRRALRLEVADLPTTPDSAAAVAVAFDALLASAQHVLTTFPRTGVTGTAEGFASPFIAGLKSTEAASANVELAATASPITDSDLAVRVALANAVDDPALLRQRAAVTTWMNPEVGPLFGEVDADAIALLPRLDAKPLSASGIEQFLGCPYQFLVERALKVNTETVTDELDAMEAKDFGTMVHEVFEGFVDSAREASLLPGPGEPWSEAAELLLQSMLHQAIEEARAKGQLGWLPAWADREQMLFDSLPEFFAQDNAMRAEYNTVPHRSEMGFGIPGGTDVMFAISDGTRVPLRGYIDRVDVDNPGDPKLVDVVDYKTGKLRSFVPGLKPDKNGGRKKVQDLVYAVAAQQMFPRAEQIEVHFFFVPNAGESAVHHAVNDDADATLRGILDEVHTTLQQGRFTPTGKAHTYCTVCQALGRRASRFTGGTEADDE